MAHKYNARKTTIDGITFDSKAEAARYQDLRLLEQSGYISELVLQPIFELQPGFEHDGKRERPITYIADFRYEQDGKVIVEDVKGMRTREFNLKRKLFLYTYGDKYEFRLTGKGMS